MKRLSSLQLPKYGICAVFVVLASLSPAFAQNPCVGAPCWEVVGTAPGGTPVLQNVLKPNGIAIKQMSLQTNLNTRVRIFEDGRILVRPVSGGILGGTPGDSATLQIQGGDFSGLASMSNYTHDWGSNIQSIVNHDNTKSFVVTYQNKDTFYVHSRGWLWANGAWFGSDRKLKEDIKPIGSALDKVLRLQGVTYHPIRESADDKSNPAEIGLIAQDVERVVPESVRTMNDGIKAVAYQNMVALLIEAIKEQQKVIDKQGKDILQLKQRLGIKSD
jgi:hypothetical protein